MQYVIVNVSDGRSIKFPSIEKLDEFVLACTHLTGINFHTDDNYHIEKFSIGGVMTTTKQQQAIDDRDDRLARAKSKVKEVN